MNNSMVILIEETNLSRAWAKAFLHIIDNSGKEISPLLITLTGFTNGIPEDQAIRKVLNDNLVIKNKQEVNTVANTIFPNSLWRQSKDNRNRLFEMYLRALPRYKALSSKNRRGIYFERLIAFGCGPQNGNQLEHIISEYKSRPGVRRTMFQASIFDPGKDHTRSAQLPFPCLQHVSFVPVSQDNSLTLNAFYATQQIFEKAYGNYLGLCRLGRFMAHEMELTFGRMNCFIGVAKMDTVSKSDPSITQITSVAQSAIYPTTDEQTTDEIPHGN